MTDKQDTADTVCFERLHAGLKQGPHVADWDAETVLHSHDPWSDFGIVDGWLWATDRSTALIEKAPEGIADIKWRAEVGRKVVAIARRDIPGPLYSLTLKDAAIMGGQAITQFGAFDLERVRDAVFWAAELDEEDSSGHERVVIGADLNFSKDAGLLFVVGPTGRVAAIMGLKWQGDWKPEITLPLREEKP